jgi:hypothetical protein
MRINITCSLWDFYGCFFTRDRASGSLEIVTNPTGLGKILLDALPMLKQEYKRHPFITNRHQETIFAAFFRSLPDVVFRRECLRMQDNGTVALDWPIGGSDLNSALDTAKDGNPLLILLVMSQKNCASSFL